MIFSVGSQWLIQSITNSASMCFLLGLEILIQISQYVHVFLFFLLLGGGAVSSPDRFMSSRRIEFGDQLSKRWRSCCRKNHTERSLLFVTCWFCWRGSLPNSEHEFPIIIFINSEVRRCVFSQCQQHENICPQHLDCFQKVMFFYVLLMFDIINLFTCFIRRTIVLFYSVMPNFILPPPQGWL